MLEFKEHIKRLLENHKLGFILGSILSLALMLLGFLEDKPVKVFIYLLTLFGAFLLSELFYLKKKTGDYEWVVKQLFLKK